jgi:hypothetical protein
MVHKEWVFCVDEEGHREEKRAADRIRTHKKKMQKRKKQGEKCKAKEMQDDGRQDIERNHQWAGAIKRVRLILPPPPTQ